MRIEVYEPKEDVTPEKVLRLKLVKGSKQVSLVAVDDEGKTVNCGYLLSIHADGTVHRHGCVSSHIGLQLNPFGEIIC